MVGDPTNQMQMSVLIANRFFIVEAVVTITFGIAIWFILPDCMLVADYGMEFHQQ